MTTTIEAGAARPPGTAARRLLLLLVALLLALTPALGAAQPAHAGSHGTGYDIGLGFLGAYRADDGRQAYCIDLGLNIPFSPTSGPTTVTSLDSISRPQLAQLNYVLAKWGQSGDPNVTAAVALFVWSLADPGVYNSHGQSGDSYYVARAPSGARPTILANLATMRSEAANNAVTDPTLSLSISMADQYQGTLTVAATPAHLQGPALLSLALFSDGSTSRTLGAGQYGITGTPAEGAPSYRIGATMSMDAYGYGAKVDLYTAGSGEQGQLDDPRRRADPYRGHRHALQTVRRATCRGGVPAAGRAGRRRRAVRRDLGLRGVPAARRGADLHPPVVDRLHRHAEVVGELGHAQQPLEARRACGGRLRILHAAQVRTGARASAWARNLPNPTGSNRTRKFLPDPIEMG